MNIILLSGGSGRRLWPLSNETRSKQFLKLLKNENGVLESMVQRVYRQIKGADIDAEIVIATNHSQIDLVKSQLGNAVDIVLEPERRDTFPAIVLASAYLAHNKDMQPSDVVIVLPVDPYADLEYFTTLAQMEQLVAKNVAKIALMGIHPTYASERYGYIVPKSDGLFVDRFQEKPNEECAERLIEEGALWNGGVFAFQIRYLMSIMEKYITASNYEDVESQYGNFPKISFDYEVVEKEKSIAVVEYSGVWRDLGTWRSLTKVMDDNAVGKTIMEENHNTHVINELNIPVVVLGTEDMVVVASPDGILVSDKNLSSNLKKYVDGISQQSMYEEHRWGEYRVLDCIEHEDGHMSITRSLFIKAGESISYQENAHKDAILTVVDGIGDLFIDGYIRNIRPGDTISLSKGQQPTIRAASNLRLIEVQFGSPLWEI